MASGFCQCVSHCTLVPSLLFAFIPQNCSHSLLPCPSKYLPGYCWSIVNSLLTAARSTLPSGRFHWLPAALLVKARSWKTGTPGVRSLVPPAKCFPLFPLFHAVTRAITEALRLLMPLQRSALLSHCPFFGFGRLQKQCCAHGQFFMTISEGGLNSGTQPLTGI